MEPTLGNYESTRQPQYSERDSLPPRLQRMITEKRQLRKLWQRSRDPKVKTKLNALCEKLKTELKEYRESPEMWRRLHRQRTVSPPPINQAASIPNAKYPTIVVETFPNVGQHLLNLTKECVDFDAICRHNRILFISPSDSEYHAIVKFLKSIEAFEPDLKYAINPLHVCIRGIPDCLLIEEVEGAITERGYVVGQIKQINWSLCYVKICGGKDNTKILEMRELLGLKLKVELWKSGPVKREMEHTEPNEPVPSTSSTASSGAPLATVPSLILEQQPAQCTENQAVGSEPSSIAKYPAIVVESFPNWPRHLENIANELGRTAYCEAWYQGIRFIPRDGLEYHAVIKYLKSIEVTEPDLKYLVRSLDVCIHGFPSNIPTDAIKTACTDRGYLVDHVKLISTDSRYRGGLHYLKICGRKDNTKILEMRDLLGYSIKVELWRGGPVKKEKNPVPSVPSNTTAPPTVPPLRSEYLSGPAPQFGNLAPAPTAPLVRPQQPVLAGPPGNQAQAAAPIGSAPPRLPAITPEQMAALTAQITALTLTVFQIFGQREQNQ